VCAAAAAQVLEAGSPSALLKKGPAGALHEMVERTGNAEHLHNIANGVVAYTSAV
jgi:hypothetical protein